MPFTFSHPAAVIPLKKYRPLPLSALIIGSMAPDVQSFLYLSTDVPFAHTLPGIAGFCIPVGILIFLLFHHLMKRPLFCLLPAIIQKRWYSLLIQTHSNSISGWFFILLSLAIGAFTHLAWDAVTHEYGWVVRQLPFLQTTVLDFHHKSLRIYTLLQHGSTLIGGLLLYDWHQKWFRSAKPADVPPEWHVSEKEKRRISCLLFAGGGLAGLICGVASAGDPSDGFRWAYRFLKNSVLMGVPAFCIFCLLFSIRRRMMQKSTGPL